MQEQGHTEKITNLQIFRNEKQEYLISTDDAGS